MFGAEPWTEAMREQLERELGLLALQHLRAVGDHRARACRRSARRRARPARAGGPLPRRGRRSERRAAPGSRRARFTTLQGGAAAAALPHRRHRDVDASRARAGGRWRGWAGARAPRRHAHPARRQPLSVRGRARPARRRRDRAPLPARASAARAPRRARVRCEADAGGDDLAERVQRALHEATGIGIEVELLEPARSRAARARRRGWSTSADRRPGPSADRAAPSDARPAASRGRQRDARVRLLAHEPLLDRDQAGLLELRQMAGEVALGQPGRALEEQEVRVADRRQDGEDREPARLVDQLVEDELSSATAEARGRGAERAHDREVVEHAVDHHGHAAHDEADVARVGAVPDRQQAGHDQRAPDDEVVRAQPGDGGGVRRA